MSSSAFSSLPQILAQKTSVTGVSVLLGLSSLERRGKAQECPIWAVVEKGPEKQRVLLKVPLLGLGEGGGELTE